YFKPGYGKAQERKFTVWFENDRLTRWSGDEQPELQPFQMNAEGKPALEKADEQLDAETARQDAAGAAAAPVDPAQLPTLGTPPAGRHPGAPQPALRQPAAGAAPPDTAGTGTHHADPAQPARPGESSPRRRELLLTAPDALPRNPIGQP